MSFIIVACGDGFSQTLKVGYTCVTNERGASVFTCTELLECFKQSAPLDRVFK